MGNEAKSAYRSMRERIAELRHEKSAQKSETELAGRIDSQIKSSGTPLTGADAKLRAAYGENILSTGAKNDEGLKQGLSDLPVTEVMQDPKVGTKVTTNKVCTTEKKAWLAAAQKVASLTNLDKVAALSASEPSIMSGIAKQASYTSDPAGVTYKEASRVVAALVGAKQLSIIEGIEKRAQATLEGKDNLHEELTPEMVQQILAMNESTPDGEMTPEEQAAIIQGAPAEELSGAAGVVSGNTGEDAELPEATDEELGKLNEVEEAVEGAEGEGDKPCKCGDPECKGCDMSAEEKTATLHHSYLCHYLSQLRGEKVAAYRARPTAAFIALQKEALYKRTIDGLRGVITGQDAELDKMASLQEKVAGLEKSAAKVQTVNPDTVNAMFAEATRANLVNGSETEIQNMKLAALSSPDELVKVACQIVRNAVAKQTNKLGSVRATRVDDNEKVASAKDALDKLRKTISNTTR